MPRIQPLKSYVEPVRKERAQSVPKCRLKRFLGRQIPNVLRISSVEEFSGGERKDDAVLGPASVCLDKLVRNFIEGSNEKQSVANCGRRRCNCFNGNSYSSDDEFEDCSGDAVPIVSSADALEILRRLTPCTSVVERNLLADTAKIVDKNRNCKRKADLRKIVAEFLYILRYDSSICKSRWEKSALYPAGEYEFIEVTFGEEKLLIDVDFRSEFEIARPTNNHKSILQSLPQIFVGKHDRLLQILLLVSESARQSLKKRGMPVPPWRKPEYMRAKWLSSSSCRSTAISSRLNVDKASITDFEPPSSQFELIFTKTSTELKPLAAKPRSVVSPWQPPVLKLRSCDGGRRTITGLASLLQEKL